MATVNSLAGVRKTFRRPSSRFSASAASLNRTSAAIHGLSSCSRECSNSAIIRILSAYIMAFNIIKTMRLQPSRRDLLLLSGFGWLWPPNWFHRRVRLGEASFREIRHGSDRRRYIWIHGDERAAHNVLRSHMRRTQGRAFLVENRFRNVRIDGGALDPNRMFSRVGAERNLKSLNPG